MTSLTHEFAVIDNNELNKNTGKFVIYDKKLFKYPIIYIHDDILCLFIDKFSVYNKFLYGLPRQGLQWKCAAVQEKAAAHWNGKPDPIAAKPLQLWGNALNKITLTRNIAGYRREFIKRAAQTKGVSARLVAMQMRQVENVMDTSVCTEYTPKKAPHVKRTVLRSWDTSVEPLLRSHKNPFLVLNRFSVKFHHA